MLYDAEGQERIQNLFTATDKIFLMGAGCSVCAGLPPMANLTTTVGNECVGDTKDILEVINGEVGGNIEDILSQLINYLSIIERRRDISSDITIGRITCDKDKLETAIREIKKLISEIILSKRKTTEHHRKFVKENHRTHRPGRSTDPHTAHYVVLNYDTLLEDALGFEGVSYCDGMFGGATGWWNPQKFNDINLQTNLLKVHGSLDWYEDDKSGDIKRLPQHMAEESEHKNKPIIIAPAESKYAETQSEPYATLLNKFDELLKPREARGGPTQDKTLFSLGYGFGDVHVNKRIKRALLYNENLTVVILTDRSPDEGVLKNWWEKTDTNERLIIYAKNALISGGKKRELKSCHDWWKFEKFVELVGGVNDSG